MTRGSQRAERGKSRPGAPSEVRQSEAREPSASIDLGMALSVYGKAPCGALVEIDASGPVPPELTTWSTEQ